MRKEENMSAPGSKARKKMLCPSCHAEIHFRPERDNLGTCPRCGEWFSQHGRWSRRLERLDYESHTDFDESSEWERSLVDGIG
jgi:Zn-finger nucleic acid-binding protein